MALAPLFAYWWTAALPMPMGELVPVTIMTFPCTRLQIVDVNTFGPFSGCALFTHGALESPAMVGILGMSSNMPGSSRALTSCSESAWTRALGDEDMAESRFEKLGVEDIQNWGGLSMAFVECGRSMKCS